MHFSKFHADALEWALTNRASLHNLVASLEILYRAKDSMEDSEIQYAEKTLWRAYELSKETLKRQLVIE